MAEVVAGEMPHPRGIAHLRRQIQRANRLDRSLYQEVRDDRSAIGSAWTVVLLSAVCQAIGITFGPSMTPPSGVTQMVETITFSFISVILLWILWSAVNSWLAIKLFHAAASAGQILRPLGYAFSPGVLMLVRLVAALQPSHAIALIVGGLVMTAVSLWIVVAGVVATRVGSGLSLAKSLVIAIVGWLVAGLLPALLLFGLAAIVR